MINKAFNFVRDCLGDDKSGHDIEHIKRVVKNAEKILKEEKNADKEVVILSAILHDVDDYKLGENKRNLESFFVENNIDEELRGKISRVIDSISFSKSGDKPNFETIEQKIVSDADKLDAMGAVGVCRTVLYSAFTKRELFNENEFPCENLTREEYKDKNRKGNHSINHFFDKLLKLKSAMQTSVGKVEAEKRHRFMVMFLREFFNEVNAPDEWGEILNKFDKT